MGITLYYFDGRGLAEPIRMILTYGGEKFDEVRAPIEAIPATIPPEVKAKCTWGQVPLVEFDGKKLAQSLAITRYFAKKHNLVPKDDFDAALCDEYVDACRDLTNLWVALLREQDEEKRKPLVVEALKNSKERYLSVFSSIIEKNGGKFLVGNALTWADIYLAHSINNIELISGMTLTSDFPAVKSHSEGVFATPGIKAWLDKRPKTKF